MNSGINMNEIMIGLKATIVISVVWSTNKLIILASCIYFIGPNFRNFLLESKDLINWSVSILVLMVTIVKLVKELKSKKK